MDMSPIATQQAKQQIYSNENEKDKSVQKIKSNPNLD